MRRLAALVTLVLALPLAAAAGNGSWAQPQIEAALGAGLMSGTPGGFRPNDPLTQAALAQIVAGLAPSGTDPAGEEPSGTDPGSTDPVGADPGGAGPTATGPSLTGAGAAGAGAVSLAALDTSLVRAVGLGDAAYRFYLGARRAGLSPPPRFGTETVARLIGLRLNHPAAQDALELQPAQPATRAEAAFSAVHALELDDGTRRFVRDEAAAFDLGAATPWQRRVLTSAVRLIGYPYIWAGTDEKHDRGFDCSGFVWRVYKLQRYPGGGRLAATLKGRTTYQMSAEVKPAQRIGFDDLQPGDVLFFGAKGPRAKPRQVDHMGVYLGNGWMIHSSAFGVALAPLDGWYRNAFAWARRPLAEANLG